MAQATGPMSHTWFVLAIEDIRGVREWMETLCPSFSVILHFK